jgi:hypothetical protein
VVSWSLWCGIFDWWALCIFQFTSGKLNQKTCSVSSNIGNKFILEKLFWEVGFNNLFPRYWIFGEHTFLIFSIQIRSYDRKSLPLSGYWNEIIKVVPHPSTFWLDFWLKWALITYSGNLWPQEWGKLFPFRIPFSVLWTALRLSINNQLTICEVNFNLFPLKLRLMGYSLIVDLVESMYLGWVL